MQKSALVGRKISSILQPGVMSRLMPFIEKALVGEAVDFEMQLTDAQGQERELWVRYVPQVRRENVLDGYIELINDITDRRRIEREKGALAQQLVQAQKMEAMGLLAGGIAHDFNNILASMIGFTELAQERNSQDEKTCEYLENVIDSGERARSLVQQMLTFGKGGHEKFMPVKLSLLVAESINLLTKMLPSSISIDLKKPQQDYFVDISPVRFQQILMNLCLNARDAMQDHGVISINIEGRKTAEFVCSSCYENVSGDFVTISIKDSGSGIPEADIGKVFEPFYTTKEVGKGSGMGLSVVHGVIHESGGHVVLRSTLGQGTEFVFYFPPSLEKKPQPEQVGSGNRTGQLKACTSVIVVVDDDRGVALFLKELLESSGYYVEAFTQAKDALAFFGSHQNRVRLVITDQAMPVMTGTQLAAALHKQNSDLPVVICTGYSDEVNQHNYAEFGVAALLAKPFVSQQLLDTVSDLVNHDEAEQSFSQLH